MGILKKIEENNCIISLWEINETLDALMQLSANRKIPDFINEKRKKEHLTSRLLLNKISPNTTISYNEFGAPILDNNLHISISHSKNFVAIIISEQQVGMDIEAISEKALRLAPKFVSEKNRTTLNKEKANLIWCLKEAVFKWHQKGKVDFIKDIIIPPFIAEEKGQIKAQFKKKELILNYQKINTHYLAYVCN
jgi:phosphopantetheinyl transferase